MKACERPLNPLALLGGNSMPVNSDEDSLGATHPLAALSPGTLISHYRVIEKIGAGGMGVVYKAEDTKLRRSVALKFLPPHLACDKEARDRFEHEAESASVLNHPNITTVYEIDEASGQCFISMEYVDGETLKELIKKRTPSLDEVLGIAIQIGEGLKAAHGRGIVHRDIKSDNIKVNDDGLVKIMDFGLAKLRGVAKLTRTGTTLGTLHYMSPEQVQGLEVDNRSDIFSFGVVIYEMVTGRLPFDGEREEAIIYSVVNDTPEPMARYRANVPADLERVVGKAMAKRRDERYQHADEMVVDLKSVRRRTETAGLGSPEHDKSIAVLPFENLSPDPGQEYFSDGLTEEVISDLSNVHALRVISRSSAMTFKGTKTTIPEIARRLNVQYVLEGSVRKAGNSLRITAQLIDAGSDAHIWAEKYSGTLDDVFDIQEKVSRAIVDALRLKLTPVAEQRMGERPIANAAAYECYLRANADIWRFNEDSLNRAIQHLQRGIDMIGDNALLYLGMADAHGQYANIGVREEEHIAKAEEYVRKALSLDPDLPKAHVVLGRIYAAFYGDQREAIRHLTKALASDPNEESAFRPLAYCYMNVGKRSMAIALLERAEQVDPLSWWKDYRRAHLYFYSGQYGLALESCRRAYLSDTENSHSQFIYARALAYNNMADEALPIIDRSAQAAPNNVLTKFGLLLKYGLLNDKEKSLAVMTPDFQATCRRGPEWSYIVATMLALVNAKKEAMDWLENAVNRGFINYPTLAEADPFLNGIRGEERFKKLMERVKYEWEHFDE